MCLKCLGYPVSLVCSLRLPVTLVTARRQFLVLSDPHVGVQLGPVFGQSPAVGRVGQRLDSVLPVLPEEVILKLG